MSQNSNEEKIVEIATFFILLFSDFKDVSLKEEEKERLNNFSRSLLNFDEKSAFPLDEYQTDKIRYMLGLNTNVIEGKYKAQGIIISDEDESVQEYFSKVHMYIYSSKLSIDEKARG